MTGSALQGDGRFIDNLKMRLKIREGVQGEGRASDDGKRCPSGWTLLVGLKMRLKIREGVQGEGRAPGFLGREGWRMTGSALQGDGRFLVYEMRLKI